MLGCDAADPKAKHAAYPVVDAAGRLLGLADAADVAAAVSPVASVHGQGAAGVVRDVMDQQVASVRAGQVLPRPHARCNRAARLCAVAPSGTLAASSPPCMRGCAALLCRARC